MYITTTGLVLRETPYMESSRILTVLTAAEGKITVTAKGAKRRKSKIAASTQLLAFSEMTLYSSRGRWTLTDARSIELFDGLRDDVELLALGSYFAEVLEAVSDEDSVNPAILSLGLNSLYALSEKKRDPQLIKSAFEIRIASLAGFEPLLEACYECGKSEPEEPVLQLKEGVLSCRRCAGDPRQSVALCPGSLAAMRHIVNADAKRIFSFTLGGNAMERLAQASEEYLKTQLEREFKTLSFYYSVKTYPKMEKNTDDAL